VNAVAYVLTCLVWTRLSLYTVNYSLASRNWVSLRFKQFFIEENDADVVCQPGVVWVDLNETLQEMGVPLFFPVRILLPSENRRGLKFGSCKLDPAPSATIGGMLSTGCSGSKWSNFYQIAHTCSYYGRTLANAVRYGTAKAEWFLNSVRQRMCLHSKGRQICTYVSKRRLFCHQEKLSRLVDAHASPQQAGM
jgi:hypothetical protein